MNGLGTVERSPIESHCLIKRKTVSGDSKKGYILPQVKDPNWFRHFNGESTKSVGRCAEPAVRPRKFVAHKRHMVLQMK